MYDTETATWTSIANMPYSLDSMLTISIEGYPNIYILGGVESFGFNHCDDRWNHEPNLMYNTETNTYSTLASLPECMVSFEVYIVVNGIIYLFAPTECQMSCYDKSGPGYSDCICSNVLTNTLWSYDTQNGIWTQLVDMPVYLSGFAVFEENNIIYTLGGYVNGDPTSYIYAYN